MRTLHRYLIVTLTLAFPLAASALNNQDVIKMHQAGLSEETILLSVQKGPAEFDTNPDALIELKTAGVSEKVIQKILAARPAAPAAEESRPAPDGAAPSGPPPDFPTITPAFIAPAVGQDYFTRYTMHEERDEYVTTNYSRGAAVPINTPVRLVSMAGARLVIRRADNGQSITVKNEEKYTKKSLAEIARLLLSAEKTPLENLPAEMATAVRVGEMRRGMTKELVLMARGYPPAHETPSTDGDRWVYWSSRFVKQTVVFENGRLAEGRGLN